MIVISMLLVVAGFVTLMLGVLNVGDEPLTFVYISIASCLAAAVFLIAGVLRSRPSRKPATASGGEGQEASWSGASSWGGDEAGPVTRDEPARATAGAKAGPSVQVVTADEDEAAGDESWAPSDDDGVVVVPKRTSAAAGASAGQRGRTRKAAKKSAKKSAKKATAKKATAKKATAKKASAKKATAKKASAKKAAGGNDAAQVEEALSNVSGVGPAKRTDLLAHFGTYRRLRAASVDKLTEVEGISETLARRIHAALRR